MLWIGRIDTPHADSYPFLASGKLFVETPPYTSYMAWVFPQYISFSTPREYHIMTLCGVHDNINGTLYDYHHNNIVHITVLIFIRRKQTACPETEGFRTPRITQYRIIQYVSFLADTYVHAFHANIIILFNRYTIMLWLGRIDTPHADSYPFLASGKLFVETPPYTSYITAR